MSSGLSSPPSSPARRQIPMREGKYVIGVCAMDAKSRSKPMRNILNRLVATGHFEVQIFGDKMILDEDITEWPACNFLISFFSTGFPLDKAIDYVALRRPYLVNDLVTQKGLFDRRIVLTVLDHIGVKTPRRLVVNRSEPGFDADLVSKLQRHLGLNIPKMIRLTKSIEQVDYDTLVVDGVTITKPFVEKPVSGEDHNIYVFFHSSQGGGCRKLFRKVANKSSEFCPDLWQVRTEGSFIYEEFMDVDNAEDVKVYTMGPMQAHAETRKSPVVDGIVQRNHDGKEVRYVTQLSPEEREYSRRVSLAFGQTICGFDLLRAGGSSYVIDVNGWSFVKNNNDYYDQCTTILRKLFLNAAKRHRGSLMLTKEISFENQWRLKGFFSVIRHADRTPKLKKKFNFMSAPFVELLGGGKEEVIFKREAAQRVAEAAQDALADGLEDRDKLELLLALLKSKEGNEDTKVQIKPSWNKTDGSLDKLQCICKWGGRFTHAGRHHTHELGESLRKDLLLINRELLEDVKVYSASEQRVIQTAEVFMESFLSSQPGGSASVTGSSSALNALTAPSPAASASSSGSSGSGSGGSGKNSPASKPTTVSMEIRRDMLDDSNAAKEQMERVKKDLQDHRALTLPGVSDLSEFIRDLMSTMSRMREMMHANFAKLDVDAIQDDWCCGESPALFRERWEKLFKEFCDSSKLDLSKVSDLYDSLKYDALHNRTFVSRIFVERAEYGLPPSALRTGTPPSSAAPSPAMPGAYSSSLSSQISSAASTPSSFSSAIPVLIYPGILRELFRKAKLLFDYVGPSEYGVDPADKREIGLLTSSCLLRQILVDLEAVRAQPRGACTRLYFTKESHVHTLLNLVYLSGVPMKIPAGNLDELDYLTQITFELYERNRGIANEADKEFSVRISFSPGAYCAELVDLQMDDRHSIVAAPKRDLTDHVSLDDVVGSLRKLIEQTPSEAVCDTACHDAKP
ncbi:inositol hexakisphosphate and diphosphoinositol-pentakisphosphate kinase [Blastocladiella emersonii ATCC 22665]|nr:inositol hexakisphosphate and diphosphoinositol-pentakisphosphate kinase [Blastocladiella emersonii ATCC 22665]